MTLVHLPKGHKSLESFLCSLELGVGSSEQNYLDCAPLDTLSLTDTVNRSSGRGSKTASLMTPQYSEILESSSKEVMRKPTLDTLTLSAPASLDPVSHSAQQESALEMTTPAICGPQQSTSSAWYDRSTHSWRTFQGSFLADTLEPFSETWPKAGMMRDGVFYPQPKWERRISAIGSGLWGTPRNSDGMKRALRDPESIGNPRGRLEDQVAIAERWPTPSLTKSGRMDEWGGSGARKLAAKNATPQELGGKLNPLWVEWLMGWPIGWTGLEPSEMGRYRRWLQQFGGS